MPIAKIDSLGCNGSKCCNCDCNRIIKDQNNRCGCKYKAKFTGSFSYNYTNPNWAEEGCGLKYNYVNNSISKSGDLIFYGGFNGMEGGVSVEQECTSSFGYRTELCDADGDEKCCTFVEDDTEGCYITIAQSVGCGTPIGCTFSDGAQTFTYPKLGSVAGIQMRINSNGQMEVINLGIMGFNGPSSSAGTKFPVTVSFPGGSQQVLLASPSPNGAGHTTTFSGSVLIS